MRTVEYVKNEKISHLEFCLEKLRMRENAYNELEIRNLYKKIYNVIYTMKELDSMSALDYFDVHINDEIRKQLDKNNIELIV